MRHIATCAVLLAAPALAATGLTVLSPTEEWNERGTYVTISGQVRNDGVQIVQFPQVVATFKGDGRVVAISSAYIDTPEDNVLAPGEVGFFELLLFEDRGFYDEVTYRASGRSQGVALDLVDGDVQLLDDTLNLIEYLGDAAIVGEFVNRTNAVISRPEMRFTLYDDADEPVGFAEVQTFDLPEEIRPGDIVSFLASSNAALDDVARWEPGAWAFSAVRLWDNPATGVAGVSWGQVKTIPWPER